MSPIARVVLVVAVGCASAAGAQERGVLDPAWPVNPVFFDIQHAEGGTLVVQSPYSTCSGVLPPAPDLTFEIRQPTKLRFFITTEGASDYILAKEGGEYWCGDRTSDHVERDASPGRYRVYFTDNVAVRHRVAIFNAGRLLSPPRGVSVPVVDVPAGRRVHVRQSFKLVTLSEEARSVGAECSMRVGLVPAMRLKIAARSRVRLDAGELELLIQDASGEAQCHAQRNHTLEPGEYLVLAPAADRHNRGEAIVEAVDLTVVAPTIDVAVNRLDEVRHLDGKLAAVRIECQDDFTPAPSFLVKVAAPIAKVRATLHAVGPVQKRVSMIWRRVSGDEPPELSCDGAEDKRSFELFEGTYALWVGGDGVEETGFDLTLATEKSHDDPLVLRAEPTAGMSVSKRRVANFFPAFDLDFFKPTPEVDATIARLWETVPRELVVFAKVDEPEHGLIAGEPLLVIGFPVPSTVTVLGIDGYHTDVPSSYLAIEPAQPPKYPAAPRVDHWPSPKWGTRYVDAIADVEGYGDDEVSILLAPAEDQKKIAPYLSLRRKFEACFGNAWGKMEGTGHAADYNLVTHRGGGVTSVENWAEHVAKSCSSKCGGSGEQAAHKRLGAQLRAARQARRAKSMKTIKQRLTELFAAQ